jgi:hypothetical protein
MSLTQREEELAIHLAETLDDMKSLLTYERFVKRYSESHLLEILDIVMKTPKEKIKNSRGAYFTFLVTQRAHSQKYYDRN